MESLQNNQGGIPPGDHNGIQLESFLDKQNGLYRLANLINWKPAMPKNSFFN